MASEGSLPVVDLSREVADPSGASPGRIRLTAISGTLASALLLVSYFFLPWIVVPEAERGRVERAFAPSLDELSVEAPELAQKVRLLVRQVADEGHMTGLDTFHYARTMWALNRLRLGDEPRDPSTDRAWVVRRALLLGAIVLAILPVGALFLFLYFVLGRFRRAGTRALVLLVILGCLGGAVTLAWMRFAEGLKVEALTGLGLELALGSTVAQGCAGLFGVTAKNWWRVYTGSIATLAVCAALAWAYLTRGATP